jgi:putative ABC transport system permease protein
LDSVSNSPPKALVNHRFADLYGEGRSMVGRHLRFVEDPNAPPTEIAGVVGDIREDAWNTAPVPYAYACIVPGGWPDPEYVVRTHGDPRTLLQAISPLAHRVDPTRAVFGVKMLSEVLESSLDQPRLNTRLLLVFAVAALALASIGLYGLVTVIVTARTREIGVRMALGAQPSQILAQFVVSIGRLLAAGIASGLVLTFIADRILRSMLFGVSPMDTIALSGAVLTLAAVSALAAWAPVRRAARIDPLEALRAE